MKELEKKIKLQASRMVPKHVLFVEEYLLTFIASEAYKTVYGAKKNRWTLDSSASKLLRNPKVTAYIRLRLEQRKNEQLFDYSFTVNKCMEIINSDYAGQTQLFSKDEFDNLDPSTRKLIQSTKVRKKSYKNPAGVVEDEYEYEVTFMSKDKALDMLNKMGGHYLTRVDHTTNGKEMKTMTDVARRLEERGAIGNGTGTNGSTK